MGCLWDAPLRLPLQPVTGRSATVHAGTGEPSAVHNAARAAPHARTSGSWSYSASVAVLMGCLQVGCGAAMAAWGGGEAGRQEV